MWWGSLVIPRFSYAQFWNIILSSVYIKMTQIIFTSISLHSKGSEIVTESFEYSKQFREIRSQHLRYTYSQIDRTAYSLWLVVYLVRYVLCQSTYLGNHRIKVHALLWQYVLFGRMEKEPHLMPFLSSDSSLLPCLQLSIDEIIKNLINPMLRENIWFFFNECNSLQRTYWLMWFCHWVCLCCPLHRNSMFLSVYNWLCSCVDAIPFLFLCVFRENDMVRAVLELVFRNFFLRSNQTD